MKRLTTLILVLLLCFSASVLFASGGKIDTGKAAVPEEPLGKYDPPITVSTVFATRAYHEFNEGDSYENNPWTRAYRDKFGINVEYQWLVPIEQFTQKLNLSIASGDIPDFFFAKPAQYNQLIDTGLIQDMTNVFKKYATPLVLQTLNEGGPNPLKSAYVDDKMYGVPQTLNSVEQGHVVFIRKDWLENLGLKKPETLQDLLTISKAFTHDDPDGNGKDDTFGFALNDNLFIARGFFAGYHAYSSIWVKKSSGELEWGGIQPEVKQALAALANMYADGQIDPEFPTLDWDKVGEKFAQNKLGITTAFFGALGYPLDATIKNIPEAEFLALPHLSSDSKIAKDPLPFGVGGYWVVKKGFEYPEAILKMMHFWVETFYYPADDEIQRTYNDRPNWYYALGQTYRATRNNETYKEVMAKLQAKDWDTTGMTAGAKMMLNTLKKWIQEEGRSRTNTNAYAWYHNITGGGPA